MTYRTNINAVFTYIFQKYGYFSCAERVRRFIRSLEIIDGLPLPNRVKVKLARRHVNRGLRHGIR